MASLFPLPSVANEKVGSGEVPNGSEKSHRTSLLVTLIGLDVLGVLLMLIGLRQQFHHQGVLPEAIDGPYAGVMMVIMGVILTLPFFIWSFKASFALSAR